MPSCRRRSSVAGSQAPADSTIRLPSRQHDPMIRERDFSPEANPMAIAALSGWTSEQKHVVAASFLGWSLDAFDFFLLVFVLKDIAAEFQTDISDVTLAILVTLAMRPIGAFIFGRAADRWGRRPTLMVNILLYSILEFASGFAPSLTVLIILRALYGVAMGGEWGVGASLPMETVPPHARGFVSGLLQSGYPAGYFMASIVYSALFSYIGWRGMFMVGVIPALLVFYIRRNVQKSPSWSKEAAVERGSTLAVLKSHWRLGIYAVVLMTAFNFFSHGTQDLYPTFLEVEHKLSPHAVGVIAVIYNIGAICGGILFGTLSERFGRRRCIIIAALLSLPVIPLWAFSDSPALLAIGAFLMQFTVQGAWGVIPAHLNELSPPAVRGTFPGFAYQLGNLLASRNAVIQAKLVERRYGGSYPPVLAWTVVIVALLVAIVTWSGHEKKGADLSDTS